MLNVCPPPASQPHAAWLKPSCSLIHSTPSRTGLDDAAINSGAAGRGLAGGGHDVVSPSNRNNYAEFRAAWSMSLPPSLPPVLLQPLLSSLPSHLNPSPVGAVSRLQSIASPYIFPSPPSLPPSLPPSHKHEKLWHHSPKRPPSLPLR